MMDQVEQFEINLEHDIDEQYQYEPGEMIRGHVLLATSTAIKVKAVLIQIKGEATVSWEDESGKGKPFRADETYIDVTQPLLDTEGGDAKELGTGTHKFPLEFVLPINLPSSFIGKFGSITYVVKATLKEAKKFGLSTKITSEPFLVLRRLDLSKEPEFNKQIIENAEKRMFGALAFCLSGKVSAKLTVNKSGHLPGEDIFMDSEITNSSPRIVKAVQAAIVMHSTFHAKHKSRYNTQIVNKKRDEWEMSYGEGRRWKNVRLTIPPYIPESRLDGCDIIDIRYELTFKVEVSGGNELRMTVPITVGTMQGDDGGGERKIYEHQNEVTRDGYATTEQNGERTEEDSEYMSHVTAQLGHLNMEQLDKYTDDDFRRPLSHGEIRPNPLFMN